MPVIAMIIGQLLGMDYMGIEEKTDRVTYKYKGDNLLARKRLVDIKAKILQLLDFPTDWPIEIRVTPTKKGVVIKEYIAEVDVKKAQYEMK